MVILNRVSFIYKYMMQTKAEIKGELAEEYLYEFVNANRGLSIYELSERLGWKAEELHNLVKRLEEGGLIRTDESEEEELKRKAEEEARARAQRELQRLKALERQLSERQAQLEARERALAENVARYSRRILSQAAGLREAMAAAMSAAILGELPQEERHELMNQLGKTQLEMVNFLSYLKEVGGDGRK